MSMSRFIARSACPNYREPWTGNGSDGIVGSGEPLVIAALAALRRLGTGFMLVAMLAVVVSTGLAAASGFSPSSEILDDAGPEHAHMHGDGTVHSHLVVLDHADDGDPLADPEHHEHQKSSCCSLAQTGCPARRHRRDGERRRRSGHVGPATALPALRHRPERIATTSQTPVGRLDADVPHGRGRTMRSLDRTSYRAPTFQRRLRAAA